MNRSADDDPVMAEFIRRYLLNVSDRRTEQDTFPAQVFQEASRWVWENQDAVPFLLVVDSFDPHEPWDPPAYYRRLYDPEEGCADVIQSPYAPWKDVFSERELKRLQANYAGEVTLVDRWFGFFVETLRTSGRLDDTVFVVISDHGHNLGHDPGDKGLVSKQGHPMTRAVADLVLLLRHPKDVEAGTKYDGIVYNHDVTATLLHMIGVEPKVPMDGKNFWPSVKKNQPFRDHATVAWGPLVTVIDDHWWYNASVWGMGPILHDLKEDPAMERNRAEDHEEKCEEMRLLAVEDAGGTIPEEFQKYMTKPGCTPYKATGRDAILKQAE